jgi:hypothetical protein
VLLEDGHREREVALDDPLDKVLVGVLRQPMVRDGELDRFCFSHLGRFASSMAV